MKDSLFEMLLHLFEQTLSKLQEQHQEAKTVDLDSLSEAEKLLNTDLGFNYQQKARVRVEIVKPMHPDAMRIFTRDEQMKFTKASYQFLMRVISWRLFPQELIELIINRLVFSESRFVNLHETKWAIRNTLAETINREQLAFLDLVLYHKEDNASLH